MKPTSLTCARGHDMTGKNVGIDSDNLRYCRECSRYRARQTRLNQYPRADETIYDCPCSVNKQECPGRVRRVTLKTGGAWECDTCAAQWDTTGHPQKRPAPTITWGTHDD